MSSETDKYVPHPVVASFVALHTGANKESYDHLAAEDPVWTGHEFDVGKYFSVLKHLSPPKGYKLDYVYFSDAWGGCPILYLRKSRTRRYANFKEYQKKSTSSRDDLASQLRADGSSESFFELLVFKVLAGQYNGPRKLDRRLRWKSRPC
jgi:hypothetical protein